ncbi:MAG: hypothetical protein HYR76_12570 [Ignavibacteria bacterium]|nr:hypothetical protein [Ignavibacteria bacterium]
MHMKLSTIIILALALASSFSCKENQIILPPTPSIGLTVEDVGVRDISLRVKGTVTLGTWALRIQRNGRVVYLSELKSQSSLDTIIVDQDGLYPKHTYTYKAFYVQHAMLVDSSAPLVVTTLDTTSHSFTCGITTLGDGLAHGFRDVAIINDTSVWAVGELFLNDSLGNPDYDPYGLAIWNGVEWRVVKVPYHDYGSTRLSPGTLRAVYAFGVNEIYVASSANLLHWDGRQWEEKAFFATRIPFDGQVNKIWGTSGANLYCGGNNGAIYFVNGTQWQKLESGTTLDITDIWGARNEKTGEMEIIAVASKRYENYERKILKISGTTVTALSDSGISTSLAGIWFVPGKKYFVAGDGIFSKRMRAADSSAWSQDLPGQIFLGRESIRGNAFNDVAVAGDQGDVLHFNGEYWRSYRQTTGLANGNYYSVAMRGNMIVAVGANYQLGVIAIGRR